MVYWVDFHIIPSRGYNSTLVWLGLWKKLGKSFFPFFEAPFLRTAFKVGTICCFCKIASERWLAILQHWLWPPSSYHLRFSGYISQWMKWQWNPLESPPRSLSTSTTNYIISTLMCNLTLTGLRGWEKVQDLVASFCHQLMVGILWRKKSHPRQKKWLWAPLWLSQFEEAHSWVEL